MESAEFLFDGPERSDVTVVLAHGAGAPMDSPFMNTIAEGLGEAGLRVARFEFPYMRARRTGGSRRAPDRQPVLEEAWRSAVSALGDGENLIIGGKSLGGRIASRIADAAEVRGLLCLGYPFHPPGRPRQLRTAHLEQLKTPALILQGTRDPFGRPDEVSGYKLSPRIRVVWIEDGDHSLKPRANSSRTEQQNLRQATVAIRDFVGSLT